MASNDTQPLSELLKPGDTLMVGTTDGTAMTSRPLTVARVDDDVIHILVDRTAEWAVGLTNGFSTHVTMSDSRGNRWVALSGTGAFNDDRALLDELWSPFAGAFFEDGKETPGASVLSIEAATGEYWNTASGRLGSLITMIKAKLGNADDVGEHGDIEL